MKTITKTGFDSALRMSALAVACACSLWGTTQAVAGELKVPDALGVQTAQHLPAPTRLLVKFKKDTLATFKGTASNRSARMAAGAMTASLPEAARSAIATTGAVPRAGFPALGMMTLESVGPMDKTIDALYRSGAVEYAVPDYYRTAQSRFPDDEPYFQMYQWGLDDFRQELFGMISLGDRDINAPEAWLKNSDASGVLVAILDSGINIQHEDLIDNLWTNAGEIPDDGIDNDGNGYVDDVYGISPIDGTSDPVDYDIGHGPINAGIIGARGGNGIGMTGVAWNPRLMGVKVLRVEGGRGNQQIVTSDSAIIEAINYVIQVKQTEGLDRVILNVSLGGYDASPALRDAFVAAQQAGLLVVTSAGNFAKDNDSTPYYPANYDLDNIITVGAIANSYEGRALFSNFGCGTVDTLAPGYFIEGPGLGVHEYQLTSGTSQSAALVSGIAALVWGQRPTASWEEVKSAIVAGVKPLPDLKGLAIGQGLVRADAALDVAGTAPVIWEANPAAGRAGTLVTLRGRHFGASAGSVHLNVSGQSVEAPVESWTDEVITARVPDGVVYGMGDFSIATAAAQTSSSACFSVTDRASAAGHLNQARAGAASMVAEGAIWVAGGLTDYGPTGTVERYDLASHSAQLNTAWLMPKALFGMGSVSLNGKLYLVGGVDAHFQGQAAVQIFDPKTGTWTQGASLPEALGYAATATVGGKIYAFGGTHQLPSYTVSGDYAATTYVYDPAADTWQSRAAMPLSAYGRSAVVDPKTDKILVLGGYTEGQVVTDQVDIYDPASDSWSAGQAMTRPRALATVLPDNDAVYVLHGDGDSFFHGQNHGEIYADGHWSSAMTSPASLIAPSAVSVDHKAYVVAGGEYDAFNQAVMPQATVWQFDMAPRPEVVKPDEPAPPVDEPTPPSSGEPTPPPVSTPTPPSSNPGTPSGSSGGGGGGSGGLGLLLPLAGLAWRRRAVSAALASALAAVAAPASAVPTWKGSAPVAPVVETDRLIVKFKAFPAAAPAALAKSLPDARAKAQMMAAALPAAARQAMVGIGAEPMQVFPASRLMSVRTGGALGPAIESLYRSGAIEYAVPDYRRKAQGLMPNDDAFGQQWGLHNIGQVTSPYYSSGLVDRDINAPEAWAVRTNAKDVLVAILDTGLQYDDAELAANIWTNPNEIPNNGLDDDGNGFVDDVHGANMIERNGEIYAESGHANAIAGLIGGVGNNGVGISGVAWRANMITVKFMDDVTLYGRDSDAIAGIEYLIALKNSLKLPRVVLNASFSGLEDSLALKEAFAAAENAGILTVAASGNYSQDSDKAPQYPASFALDTVVSVGSINSDDIGMPSTSNYGCSAVDLLAPGQGLLTTLANFLGPYSQVDGTSFSAALVTGVAALVWAEYPMASARDIKGALLHGVKQTPDLQGRALTEGWVRADAVLAAGPNLPAIWNATPVAAGPGQSLTVHGHRFGANPGKLVLRRATGDLLLNVVSWSDTAITATVPEGVGYGAGQLVAQAAGGDSNSACFAVAERPVAIGEMAVPRSDAAYAQVGDDLWIIGGTTAYGTTARVERFDTATRTSVTDERWMMPLELTWMRAAAIGKSIYVAGGMDAFGTAMDALQIFDTETGTWSTGAALPEGLIFPAVVAVGDKLFVFGGNRNQFQPFVMDDISNKVYRYDPKTNTWDEPGWMPMPQAVANAGASYDPATGKVSIVGGYMLPSDYAELTPTAKVQVYDTRTQEWSEGQAMQHARHGMGLLRHGDALYALLGVGDPTTGVWDDGEMLAGDSWSPSLHADAAGMAAVGQAGNHGFILGGYEPNIGVAGMAKVWQFEFADTPNSAPPASETPETPPASAPGSDTPPPSSGTPSTPSGGGAEAGSGGGGGAGSWPLLALWLPVLARRLRRRT